MRHLYIGPSCNVARIESLCGFWLGRGYVRLDIRRRASVLAPAISRSIWSDLPYFPGPDAGHMYTPELLCLYLYGEVVCAGVRLELSFCPDHVVVSQPRYALMVRAPVPRHQIEVAVYASGNFWLGTQGRIPWLLGH